MADVPTLSSPQYPSITPRHTQDVEYVVLAGADGTAEKGLREYLHLFWRRKWLVLLSLVCIMPWVGLHVATQTPRYTAKATVLIEDTNPKVIAIPDVVSLEGSSSFYSTQYELIKSRAVAEEVVDTLQLHTPRPAKTDSPGVATLKAIKAFPERVVQAVIAWVTPRDGEMSIASAAGEASAVASAAADRQRQSAVGRLRTALAVSPRKGLEKGDTKLVDIIVQGDDPSEMAQQVNAVAAVYVRQNLEKRLDTSRKASVWLQREAATLRDTIAGGERRLQALKEDKRLVASEAGQTQSSDLQSLGTLNLSYLEKRRERMALRADLDELQKVLTSVDLLQSAKHPALLNNPSISGLRTRYTDLKIRSAELAKKFMDKHPKMVTLTTELEEVSKAMTGEVRRVIASLENQYNTLVTQENELNQLVNTQKSTVIKSGKDLTEYDTLRRDLDVHKAMYQEVSKRFAETTITSALQTNNVTVVEPALAGTLVPSQSFRYLLLGLFLSLGCGGGLALLVDVLDRRFKNVAEVEQSLALPVLGLIPYHVVSKRRFPALITLQKPISVAAEAYYTVRTWVQLAQPPIRSLLVTSACPSEGKSTTAANLAVSFAQLGRRVLLVDTDLRQPSLQQVFGATKAQGLTEVLVQGWEWHSVVRETPLDNLKILFAGSCVLNPTDVLSMARLKNLIESWKAYFDLVILDSSVVLSISDVMLLAPEMDGVLLVHSQGRSTREMAIEAKRLLERVGAKLLGMVFNHVRPNEGYYYTHSYGSTYRSAGTGGRLPQDAADRGVETSVTERRTTAALQPLMGSAETASLAATPVSMMVGVGSESHSGGVHMILHAVTRCQCIGQQQAAAGMVFLIVDVEITNEGAFGHLFDPGLTALLAREETDYGRVLASFIPIEGADDDTERFQTARVLGHYDAALTGYVGGFASEVEITVDHSSRGNLVYQMPEAGVSYTFVYTNPPITLALPFTLQT